MYFIGIVYNIEKNIVDKNSTVNMSFTCSVFLTKIGYTIFFINFLIILTKI